MAAAAGTARAADPALVIQDPEVLSQLEERGLSVVGVPVEAEWVAVIARRA